jgi:hypothetical protein
MRRIFFPAPLLCLLCACAPSLRVEIDAFAERPAVHADGKKCAVLPATPDVRPDDLQFREFAAQTSESLAERGCAPAEGLEDADLAVLLSYGVGEPVTVEQRDYVIYRPWGRWRREIPEFVPVTTTYVFNTYSIALEARSVERAVREDARSGPDIHRSGGAKEEAARQPGARQAVLGRQVWKVRASHASRQGDLRVLFPWLLAGAKDYFGADSGHSVVITVPEKSLAPSRIRNNGK